MKLKTVCILVLIVSISLYISSCFLEDTTNPVTFNEINECFYFYVKHGDPKTFEVEERILGEWTLKNSVDEETVLFNPDRRYFILKNTVILEQGTFNIKKDKDVFFIETSKNNTLVNGIIVICSPNAYNVTTNQYWFKICDCFI